MTDAFIYDHVRTPRGRGKPDGSLHEVSTLGSRPALKRCASATISTPKLVDDVVIRLRRSGRRSGRRRRARRRARMPTTATCAGRADQPLLRLGPRCGEFRRRAGDVGPARDDHRRRRRSMSRVGIGASGGAWPVDPDRDQVLFHAAGRVGRSHRHQIRLLARRRRRLCGGIPEARRERPGRRAASRSRRAGEGRQRPHHPRPRRAHAPDTTMQSLASS
jgi:hypothetical protein